MVNKNGGSNNDFWDDYFALHYGRVAKFSGIYAISLAHDWLQSGSPFVDIGCGMCFNLQYIIIGTRLNPMLLGTSLEMCFCFANLVAAVQPKKKPILANYEEPVPIFFHWQP